MKYKYEGEDIRACIDKAYDAGYRECLRKACKWLHKHMPFGDVSIGLRNEVFNDFKNYIKQ